MLNSIINKNISDINKNKSNLIKLNNKINKNVNKNTVINLRRKSGFNEININSIQNTINISTTNQRNEQVNKIVTKTANNLITTSHIDPRIKSVAHVYQYKYKTGEVTGFGDYIRGCYYVLQFCERNGLNYKLQMVDHAIQSFISYFEINSLENKEISKNIEFNSSINIDMLNKNDMIYYAINKSDDEFIQYINNSPIYDNTAHICTMYFPRINISEKHKCIMRNVLEPIEELKIEVEKYLSSINLDKNNFTTIHVRYGDDYLINNKNEHEQSRLNKLIKKIKPIVDKNNNILLLCDCNDVKNMLKTQFPKIKCVINEITHMKDVCTKMELIKNTLVDFYLMSYASNIVSYTIYDHGTGFSKWCAVTYDIPYVCFKI